MASSQINKAIKSIWKKADLEGAPSSTLFRKSAVSNMHSYDESNFMAHNLSTAKNVLSIAGEIEVVRSGL